MNQPASNPFVYSNDNKRYHTWNYYLRNKFGCRVAKIPVRVASSCPNRDGSRGSGGCTFCSGAGSGEGAGSAEEPLVAQYAKAVALRAGKWPAAKYIVYFQAFSSTYLPVERLRKSVQEALALPGVVGIAIATRADCLPAEVLEYLEWLNRQTWLVVELGLQTVHDSTARRINRCHTYSEFLSGYHALQARGVATCVHLLNGLPGESVEMMRESARQLAALAPHSVKIHMLNLLRGTALAAEYEKEPFALLDRAQYIALLCDQLEYLPPGTVVQRITGDAVAGELIAPQWAGNKLAVRNGLDQEFFRRGSMQGARYGQGESNAGRLGSHIAAGYEK